MSEGHKKNTFLNPFFKLRSIEQSTVKYADYRKKLLFLSIVHRLIPIEGHCSSIKVLAQCIAQVGLGHWLMLQLTINTNMFSGLEVSLWIIWSPGPFLPSWGRISSFSICGVRTMKMEKENKKLNTQRPESVLAKKTCYKVLAIKALKLNSSSSLSSDVWRGIERSQSWPASRALGQDISA